jgi:hypothetical protein
MPQRTRASCKNCGGHRDDVGLMSWEGFCGDCGPKLRDKANDEMHYHRGPAFEVWRRAMAACVGGVLLDGLDSEA